MKRSELISIINEELLRERNVKSLDAWNGKLENTNKVLTDNYDLMTKADQTFKDDMLRKYYRLYNDGDIPTFGRKVLEKLGMNPKDIEYLTNMRYSYGKNTTQLRRDWHGKGKHQYNNQTISDHTSIAIEKFIRALLTYFLKKYPDFFKSENRNKTLQSWKNEILDNIEPSSYTGKERPYLKAYWVVQFGKEFGLDDLLKYNPYGDGPYKGKFQLKNPNDIEKISKIINDYISSHKELQ